MISDPNSAPKRGRLSSALRKRLCDGEWISLIRMAAAPESGLDLQVRDNYLNIYYRGGNLLRVKPRSFSFDKYYFYRRGEFGACYPKSYVECMYKGTVDRIPEKTTFPVPTREEAEAIVAELCARRDRLVALLPEHPQDFFRQAKAVMDLWFGDNPKEERGDQHEIALANRGFDGETDLVVIDLEYAVSRSHPYNKAVNSKGGSKVCRFDIVAVSRTGQVYVIELKQNEAADSEENAANVRVHARDFDDTIGNDGDNLFLSEMADVVEIKSALGLLGRDIRIDRTKKPIFAVAYSGPEAATFNEKYAAAGMTVVRIEKRKLVL